MSLYIYKKYRRAFSAWSSETIHTTSNYAGSWDLYITAYSQEPQWDSRLGKYVTIGSPDRTSEGWEVYNEELSAQKAFHHDRYEADNGAYSWWSDVYTRTRVEIDPVYVGEVTAEEGTYPDEGLHSDGYYYEKDRLAFPQLGIRVDNVWLTSELGWCKIDSVWREIDEIHINVNGIWKKSE